MTAKTTHIKSFSSAANGDQITNITPAMDLPLSNGQVFNIVSLQGVTEGTAFLIEFSLNGETQPDKLLLNKTSMARQSPVVDHLLTINDRMAILQYCHEIALNYETAKEFQRLTDLNNQGLLPIITVLDDGPL
ncbi:MAG: hypothetical protein A3B66_08390 [Alphaproteobacteria bacterium RIFCSPHIGHO2_02_FULL_46_13]|nr:MAG: hypothetical protein A3B66_08390 [Alphaproteobacteria bacterium RIFCSPHIGHO2_02_FULL_46_13]